MDLRLSTVNTAEKINSVFAPVTRVEGLMDHSDWIASRHRVAEVTDGRVSKVHVYSNYIKISVFKTRYVLAQENIQMT